MSLMYHKRLSRQFAQAATMQIRQLTFEAEICYNSHFKGTQPTKSHNILLTMKKRHLQQSAEYRSVKPPEKQCA